ncbi:MAG: DUF3800 domain-containing protein [Opitutia bacterium]
MHLLYVDESGDTGLEGSQTRTFTLSGLMVHHAEWHEAHEAIGRMRRRIQEQYGYPRQAELHACEMLGRSHEHHGTRRGQRVQSVLHAVEMIRRERRLTPLRVVVEKGRGLRDVNRAAWLALLGAASKHIVSHEGHARCSAPGLAVICDDHRTAPSAAWLNEINAALNIGDLLIDEPFGRDSRQSPLLQLCDLLAYLTKQAFEPNALFRKTRADSMLKRCEALFAEKGATIVVKEEGGAFAPP